MTKLRRPLRLALLLIASVLVLPAVAAADEPVVTAPQAWAEAQAGELLIVDVRTEAEWRETGVVPGSARVSLYSIWGVPNDGFVEDVLELAGGDRTRPVAVICATGGRSAYAADMLRDAGFTRVEDIGEGMFGSDEGVGWLSRALPVEPCDTCPPS